MYQYTESGLNNVWLNNGYRVNQDNGDTSINDKWNLHYALACELISRKAKLSVNEFKYLRGELKATQATLANALGVNESTVRNWEHGRTEISPIADRLVRVLYRSCADDNTDVMNLVNKLVYKPVRLIKQMRLMFLN